MSKKHRHRFDEGTAPSFTARNVAFAGVGLGSLIICGLSLALMMSGGPGGNFGRWLFISSPAIGLAGVILNIKGLVRIREGQAGDYDLILTWPGFFGASLTCLLSMALLLLLVA